MERLPVAADLQAGRADTIDAVAADPLLASVKPGQVAPALAAAEEVTARWQRSLRAGEGLSAGMGRPMPATLWGSRTRPPFLTSASMRPARIR